jgi:hypothetical protein
MLKMVPERSRMFRAKAVLSLLGTLGTVACAVAPPTGPSYVLALPPQGKNLAEFQQEDNTCRGFAERQIGYGSQQQQANQSAIGSSAIGTALGAAAGAAIGAAGGSAGTGAAVGAGNATASAETLQQHYDTAYAQCMTASGDSVQAVPVAAPYTYAYGGPAYFSPWFGPPVAFGFFGGLGHRFHHHHHHFFHNHG